MRIPNIDNRTEKDIIKYIKKIQPAYTPEWRFEEKNPDVGSALAMIYTDMFYGTIRKFNHIPRKNRIAFYNEIDAGLLPAIPAFGYVTFGLSGAPVSGEAVKKGTQLIADTEDEEEGTTIFETENDVFVTAARIQNIFCTSGANDFISCVADETEFNQANKPDKEEGFYLFDIKAENLQQHVIYFSQAHALNIKKGAWIEILLNPHYQHQVPKDQMEALLDARKSKWEYYTDNGWESFDGQKVQGGRLLFFKSERQPAFAPCEINKMQSCLMRCTVNDMSDFENLSLDRIEISSMGAGLEPDMVLTDDIEQNIHEFFPFGEKMSLYSDVYIAAEDALCKKGADIRLTFNLNFIRIPVDLDMGASNVNWKLIMKRSEFKPDKDYDITIEDVIWEYYNGNGWTRLFPSDEYRDTFTTEYGTLGQFRVIDFKCPMDMEKILIGSFESYYIRVRVLKVNNLYKTKGEYVAPVIDGMAFSYDYKEKGRLPEYIYTENNLERKSYEERQLSDDLFFFKPFYTMEQKKTALYLGFDMAPSGGPVKMLFDLKDTITDKLTRISWEYYSDKEWRTLNVTDETENLKKTGIVTFMGPGDFKRSLLWNRELYWIRLIDNGERYNNVKLPVQLPRLLNIYMNTTQIKNVQTNITEYFYAEPQDVSFQCQLLHNKIQEVQVQVLEEGNWVNWTEVEDFIDLNDERRRYTVDRNEGIVRFSDRKEEGLVSFNQEETIKVTYSTGGGSIGNLPKGAVNRTAYSIGFINEVDNPSVTFGGCDIEETEAASYRNGQALKHGYRAVTAGDFESMALEATRNIYRAKCFPGYNELGSKTPGALTLALLQKDFMKGRAYFGAVAEQVKNYIEKRCSSNIIDLNRFFVVEPQFMEMCVKVELSVREYNQVFKVKEQIENRLNEFLNPLTGNFDGRGWNIGRLPNPTQVLNCLKDIEDISYLKNVFVSAYTEGKFGRVEADLDKAASIRFALPLAGTHEIIISVDEGR